MTVYLDIKVADYKQKSLDPLSIAFCRTLSGKRSQVQLCYWDRQKEDNDEIEKSIFSLASRNSMKHPSDRNEIFIERYNDANDIIHRINQLLSEKEIFYVYHAAFEKRVLKTYDLENKLLDKFQCLQAEMQGKVKGNLPLNLRSICSHFNIASGVELEKSYLTAWATMQLHHFLGSLEWIESNFDERKRLYFNVEKLPSKPGVYRFYDKWNNLIYVGKAINIKKRIQSHFSSSNRTKTANRELISLVDRIDFDVYPSEIESLIFENTLIKRYLPPYNKALKNTRDRYKYITEAGGFSSVFETSSVGPVLWDEDFEYLTAIVNKSKNIEHAYRELSDIDKAMLENIIVDKNYKLMFLMLLKPDRVRVDLLRVCKNLLFNVYRAKIVMALIDNTICIQMQNQHIYFCLGSQDEFIGLQSAKNKTAIYRKTLPKDKIYFLLSNSQNKAINVSNLFIIVNFIINQRENIAQFYKVAGDEMLPCSVIRSKIQRLSWLKELKLERLDEN